MGRGSFNNPSTPNNGGSFGGPPAAFGGPPPFGGAVGGAGPGVGGDRREMRRNRMRSRSVGFQEKPNLDAIMGAPGARDPMGAGAMALTQRMQQQQQFGGGPGGFGGPPTGGFGGGGGPGAGGTFNGAPGQRLAPPAMQRANTVMPQRDDAPLMQRPLASSEPPAPYSMQQPTASMSSPSPIRQAPMRPQAMSSGAPPAMAMGGGAPPSMGGGPPPLMPRGSDRSRPRSRSFDSGRVQLPPPLAGGFALPPPPPMMSNLPPPPAPFM